MYISIISVFPQLHEPFLACSLIGRAIEQEKISINLVRFSDFCQPKDRIDQPTAGPGTGMIIKPEVVEKAINYCQEQWGQGYKIFFSPQGQVLTQGMLRNFARRFFGTATAASQPEQPQNGDSKQIHIILVCSRYEGMDERVQDEYADCLLSIGDYVLMGGDVAAQVFLEGLLRLLPGVVGKWESVEHDSFSSALLDYPEYGLPVEWHGKRIPEIIQSGNHAAIAQWRLDQACKKTILKRFDWFVRAKPNKECITQAWKNIPHHYVALMHTQVKLGTGEIGTTSITSIDLHDTSRSCATYGIKNFFIVSPLADQQDIMQTFLSFWKTDVGREYNQSRYDAIIRLLPSICLDDVKNEIFRQTGRQPLIICTSAQTYQHEKVIDYASQNVVWQHDRPVLFLFGTGQGLADEVVDQSDFLLLPVQGLTAYNHLSVRSAMAIILDRWLGLHPRLD